MGGMELRGVAATAADCGLLYAPCVDVVARLAEGRGDCSPPYTKCDVIPPIVGNPVAPIFNTLLPLRLTVLCTRGESITLFNAFAKRGHAHRIIAAFFAGEATGATMLAIALKVLTCTVAGAAALTRQRDRGVLGGALTRHIKEFGMEHPLDTAVFKFNRLDLIDGTPRHGDRIGTLLTRGHKRPVGERAILRKERAAHDILNPVRVAQGRRKNDRLAIGDLSDVCREGEKKGRSVSRSCRTAVAGGIRARRFRRVCSGRGRSRRCTRRSCHRRLERARRLGRRRIICSAGREPDQTHNQKSSAHGWSLAKNHQ